MSSLILNELREHQWSQGVDIFTFNVPDGQEFSFATLEFPTNSECARIETQPLPGTTGTNLQIRVHWKCLSVVSTPFANLTVLPAIYRIKIFTMPSLEVIPVLHDIPEGEFFSPKMQLLRLGLVLGENDITNLAELGDVKIGEGETVVCNKPGILNVQSLILNQQVPILNAFKLATGMQPSTRNHTKPFQTTRFTGMGKLLNMQSFKTQPTPNRGNFYDINDAYWPAKSFDIPDNTTIVLKYPVKSLFIIAEKITVGKNVTFTWERPGLVIPDLPEEEKTKIKKNLRGGDKSGTILNFLNKTYGSGKGGNGGEGVIGNLGSKGDDAPKIELWTLEWSGLPFFDLAGQDGGQGGTGGDGGDGGKGAQGKSWKRDRGNIFSIECSSGPGNGGNGGKGGRAGKGGPGGPGGHGGRFTLYATPEAENQFPQAFYIDVSEGRGGPGGNPGQPGQGGPGGKKGTDRSDTHRGENNCPQDWDSGPGEKGPPGDTNISGDFGLAGEKYPDAIQFEKITREDFVKTFEKPAIVSCNPLVVKVGDVVSVIGKRFTPKDIVVIDGIECSSSTTFLFDTSLSFTVPPLQGGYRFFSVKQQDGTLSANQGNVQIIPTLSHAVNPDPDPKKPFKPGTWVTLVGSGFTADSRVLVNEEHVYGSNVELVDSQHLRFRLIRPNSAPHSPEGEQVTVKVSLPFLLEAGQNESNEITITLDTYRMVVLGDSVVWGQGLNETEKFHYLVAEHLKAIHSEQGFYKEVNDVKAHSGASINPTDEPRPPKPFHGEISCNYPTIHEQVASFTDEEGKTVDFVLLDGGYNDLNIFWVHNPLTTTDAITTKAQDVFYDSMKELLGQIVSKFKNATIVVTGYYPVVTAQTDSRLLTAFLTGVGIISGGMISLGNNIVAAFGGVAGAYIADTLKENIIRNSELVANLSKSHLDSAVEEEVAKDKTRTILFANPEFKVENALFAPSAWVWGFDQNSDTYPDDPIADFRDRECHEVGRHIDVKCFWGSFGHPNIKGAREYAKVINELL